MNSKLIKVKQSVFRVIISDLQISILAKYIKNKINKYKLLCFKTDKNQIIVVTINNSNKNILSTITL